MTYVALNPCICQLATGFVTEPPKVLGPPTVVLVLRTLDNPVDALNHSTILVTVSSSFRPRALHPSRLLHHIGGWNKRKQIKIT
jgi:hypothetical protein